ncbi:sugar phosphate isomerase/epimerase family protein [Pseudolysinimonas sp.]|uniref:sugar phosphate isomerase/epimerase family protein n=1 Tax=Pseudolysinimonas sp. TaxID=2680009 RepID=UPI003F822814
MIPLAFSTLGAPDATAEEIGDLARTPGWGGIELRSLPGSFAWVGSTAAELDRARAALHDVEIVCLSTSVFLAEAESDAELVRALVAEGDLARALGAPALRVFAGAGDDELLARRLGAAVDVVDQELWLETHDARPTGAAVARVLERVDSPRVGAVWDIAHPRAAGEPIATTAHHLAPWLRLVQIKDERRGSRHPVVPGEGDIPLDVVLAELRDRGFSGRLSLEWERRWHPDIDPLPVAMSSARSWVDAASARLSPPSERPSHAV